MNFINIFSQIIFVVILSQYFSVAQIVIETGCKTPCDTCINSFEILSIDHTDEHDGVYFNFDKTIVDNILDRNDWIGQEFVVVYNNIITYIILSDNIDGASSGTGSGVFSVNNPIGKRKDYFSIGDDIFFLNQQKCLSCLGDTSFGSFRNSAPSCLCKDNFKEGSEQFKNTCQIDCSHQCSTCQLGNYEECLECKDSGFLMPHCLYPKKGYIAELDSDGKTYYLQCQAKCLSCGPTIDKCIECTGLNRIQSDNCICEQGYFDNNGSYTDCYECDPTCNSCKNQFTCQTCKDDLNRELDQFTLKCNCKRGYAIFEETVKKNNGRLICEKCYMIADQCILQCPRNTIQNEETGNCEPIQYNLLSNMLAIYTLGACIVFLQVLLCLKIKSKLKQDLIPLQCEYEKNRVYSKLRNIMKKQNIEPSNNTPDQNIKKDIINENQQQYKKDSLKNVNLNTQASIEVSMILSPIKKKVRRSTQKNQFSVILDTDKVKIGNQQSQNLNNNDSKNNLDQTQITDVGTTRRDLQQSENEINIFQSQDISPIRSSNKLLTDVSPHKKRISQRQMSRKKRNTNSYQLGSQTSLKNDLDLVPETTGRALEGEIIKEED